MEPAPIAPDLKDWTWVIDRPCPECGYVAADIDATELGALVRDNAATWRAERYGEQDPVVVAAELSAAAEEVAATYDAGPEGAWHRPGQRSNGSQFTVESLGRYHLHDVGRA